MDNKIIQPNLYGLNLGEPLSAAMDSHKWYGSVLEGLSVKSEGNVYLRRIPDIPRRLPLPDFAWYVTHAQYSDEDSTNTIFQSFMPDNSLAPISIGVYWDSLKAQIGGMFKYKPEFGHNYYHVIGNKFHTVNTGGYVAQVLDLNYPSEGLSFGFLADEGRHKCLIVTFQLLPFQN